MSLETIFRNDYNDTEAKTIGKIGKIGMCRSLND